MFAISEAGDLNQLAQGGQLYWASPFSKSSLVATSLFWAIVSDEEEKVYKLRRQMESTTVEYIVERSCDLTQVSTP